MVVEKQKRYKTPGSFRSAVFALIGGALAMGISPIFVRICEVGPFTSAFWRVGLAVPVLFMWVYFEQRRNRSFNAETNISRSIGMREFVGLCGPLRYSVIAGLFFAGDLFFWHLAIMHTTIANATLLATIAPLWVALLGGIILGERLGWRVVIGLILCFIGVTTLIGNSLHFMPEYLYGDIYGFITSFFFGLYFIAIRLARRFDRSLVIMLVSSSVTAVFLLVVALVSEDKFLPDSIRGYGALIALALISHVGGQGLLAYALGHLPAIFSALIIFIEALIAAFFGWLVFGEVLGLLQIAGGLIVLYGIWFARPHIQ